MGMKKLFSRGNYAPPNPDPRRFKILRMEAIASLTVVYVDYPGCTTFGGKKVSVYARSEQQIASAVELDPHFSDREDAPIARFPGTEQGWNEALEYASWRSRL